MKTKNILVAIIVALIYNTIQSEITLEQVFQVLLLSGMITGIIMIFKKDRSNWSSIFMWVTIVICIIFGILESQKIEIYPPYLFIDE